MRCGSGLLPGRGALGPLGRACSEAESAGWGPAARAGRGTASECGSARRRAGLAEAGGEAGQGAKVIALPRPAGSRGAKPRAASHLSGLPPQRCAERITQTVEITKHVVDIEEKGVKLRLTIVDTPGFGDAVNNTECWKPVADYIDQQFEQYFRDESGLNRKNIQDNRVHCCLYFISPFGHGLRPLDVEFMRALHQRVNIVPILAKADTLTPSEVERKKSKIREEIEHYGIRIYQFPECDSDEDEDFKLQDQALKESIPFAVIGSNTVVEAKGRRVRGRLYPWGIVEVENPAHCDFVKLRTMLVKTHMQDLKDVTRETHYENYRAQCIQSMTRMVVKERNRNKLTRESGTDFPIPAIPAVPDSETEKLIREKDEELRRMQEMLQKIQRQMKDSH
nr:septin-4 isoform X6 [Chrysemys picta bellii]